MSTNITYLFGAGASYYALPLVKNFKGRFQIFCDHLNDYLKIRINEIEFSDLVYKQKQLIKNIESHYTIDTYAKKLFLKNPLLHTNPEYRTLTNYLSAYFLYEQLKINPELDCNQYLVNQLNNPYNNNEDSAKDIEKIFQDFDYRYDSFFASILTHSNDELIIPNNINLISWNYDFQIEKAYMNFSECNLTYAIERLNVIGTPQETFDRPLTSSHLIKLNGSAGFLSNGKFSELFDFRTHKVDNTFFERCKEILLSTRTLVGNAIRFSWEGDSFASKAIEMAQQKITNSRIVVVIGYSFPYFNREIDRMLFRGATGKNDFKVYIQGPQEDINSVIERFKGVAPFVKAIPFTETDQFLIPNELTL
ncbi:MAG TPA: hypothetical protein PLN49_11905 [Ferruginibacter sp.]|jgi:hypothetical protein|nr:hypothetical protein [Chitinophagales bacterium]HMX79882.1 hypothetical protein [Ferruginibacter sp.]HNA01564.1 hypothetical protein [Ferruginibacter sp.]HNN71123.1 hypothetical protein [Ferruginibacter sp.]